tara:strand:+ start:745 stop:1119 length:375 start_codon:yes stop_codon:yes gene_type:complete
MNNSELAIEDGQCVVCHSKKTCYCGLQEIIELYGQQVCDGEAIIYCIEGENQEQLVGYAPRAFSIMLKEQFCVIQYLGNRRVTVLNVECQEVFDEVSKQLSVRAKHIFKGKEKELENKEEDDMM